MLKSCFLCINILFFAACGGNKSISGTSKSTDSGIVKPIRSNTVSVVTQNTAENKDSISSQEMEQDTSSKNTHHKMYPLKLSPYYPGGITAALQFVQKNVHYPEEALKNNISGTVYVDFRIMRDGSVSAVTIRHGLGYGCDEEAIRVIKLLKGWKIGGRVFVPYGLPVKFEIPAK